MKKLLVVLLALTFVVAMATAAFAVTTATVDGKVEWTLTSADQFGGSVDGKIVFDLAKDFGEGYSAGLKIKLTPGDNTSGWVLVQADTAPSGCLTQGGVPFVVVIDGKNYYYVKVDVDKNSSVAYDGDGWVKMVKDFGTITFQTGGLGGNAANELGVDYDMAGNAGIMFESTSLMEGLALTAVLNDNALTGVAAEESPNKYNYLIKAVYSVDPLTLGFGYQMHTQLDAATDSAAQDAMAIWAGYKLSDALSFGLEYASRPNADGLDVDLNVVEGSTAILLKADYTADALTINGKVLMTTGSFWLLDPDDKGTTSAWNFFKYGVNRAVDPITLLPINVDPSDGTGVAGTALKIDASYKLTDALSVALSVEDIMTGAVIGTTGVELVDDQLMSYKLSVTDVMSEQLTLDGWYAGYGPISELGAKATYTFVAGLVGSLEVKSVSTEGVDDADNSYTAKIVATL